MSMPFYVAPEQMMKDRADYARKGIARGRSLIAVAYDQGILLCAENPSRMLRKISEIYDRIGFAGVGKYNEFDQLRIAGVRHADLKGFSYSREDVDARSLANQYAQMLGQVFTHEMKPMEVEILVAEVGKDLEHDQLFHIQYDGTLVDEQGFTVLGGDAEAIRSRLSHAVVPGSTLAEAIAAAVGALAGPDRRLTEPELEVAVLDRNVDHRAFRRIVDEELEALLPSLALTTGTDAAADDAAADAGSADPGADADVASADVAAPAGADVAADDAGAASGTDGAGSSAEPTTDESEPDND